MALIDRLRSRRARQAKRRDHAARQYRQARRQHRPQNARSWRRVWIQARAATVRIGKRIRRLELEGVVQAGEKYQDLVDGRAYRLSSKVAPRLRWWVNSDGTRVPVTIRMRAALAKAKQNYGVWAYVTTGYRTDEHEEYLWWHSNYGRDYPKAPPGTSNHSDLVDGAADVANWQEFERIDDKVGLDNLVARDEVHFSPTGY